MKILFALVFLFTSSTAFSQYAVDTSKSSVRWYGYYLFSFGEHFGTIGIKQSNINAKDGAISSAKVVLDMNSITTLDMPADDGGVSLSNHLKSADFFDVVLFPEAQFDIVSISPIKDASPEGPNFDVTGSLTLKGVKNNITFPAIVQVKDEITLKAKFKFDRTKWNVQYNSGKFFSEIGDGAISDAIGIELNIIATKTPSK